MEQYKVIVKTRDDDYICTENEAKIITQYCDMIYYFNNRHNNIIFINTQQYITMSTMCRIIHEEIGKKKDQMQMMFDMKEQFIWHGNKESYFSSRIMREHVKLRNIPDIEFFTKLTKINYITNFSDVDFVYGKN